MVEATTKLDFEYTQAIQTLKLQAEDSATTIRTETEAKVRPPIRTFRAR